LSIGNCVILIYKEKIMAQIYTEEASMVKRLMHKKVEFMFIPNGQLLELVARDEHPKIKALPNAFKYVLLENKPIRIDAQMALNYYEGKLDNNNSFILSYGDIKIVPERFNQK